MYIETSLIVLLAFLAFLVSWTSNVFMSLMYSVALFVNATAVLLVLGFEFLALVNMLVYVGALAVLFLFVIMLLEIPSAQLQSYKRGYGVLAALGLLSSRVFYNTVNPISLFFDSTQPTTTRFLPNIGFTPTVESISHIGTAFYVRYADVLILNSLILTIALFGALVLAQTSSVSAVHSNMGWATSATNTGVFVAQTTPCVGETHTSMKTAYRPTVGLGGQTSTVKGV